MSPPIAFALLAASALLGVAGVDAATVSKNAKEAFITRVAPAAQQAQRSYGVPASVSIAQAIVDSDWGTSEAVKKGRNYFDTACGAKMTAGQFAGLAEDQVGKPYVLGAEVVVSNPDPAEFDCSELVQWLYARSGNRITDLAAAQYNVTKRVSGSPKTGDLVFLRNNPARANGIGHVAVLTKKLGNGDWRIIEARGRAYGVVRTTLSYWKTRKYYAGLRRSSSFALAGKDGVAASAASAFQAGCFSIGKTGYAKYNSINDSFAAHAAAVMGDSAYASARKAIGNIPDYVTAIAKAEHGKDAAAYAAKLTALIAEHDLRDYDTIALTLVLVGKNTGAKVTALQYLLRAAGHPVAANGRYDAATASAVKKFQKAKRLEVDGEAGPLTLAALSPTLASGATGEAVRGLSALLTAAGQPTSSTASFTSTVSDAVSAFQTAAGRTATGRADARTWAALFMSLDGTSPTIGGKARVGETLTASTGNWGPGSVDLGYQWYRGDQPVAGSTKATHRVSEADAGSELSVRVTGKKRMYTTTVRSSAATAAVPRLTLSATPTPTITGTAEVGKVLTAKPGKWAPAPVALAYQWYRGSARIDGATAPSYSVAAADGGAKLSVQVISAKLGYWPVIRTSAATAAVPHLLTAATPAIAGTPRVGSELTARPGEWGPAGVSLAYQWYRDGKAIKGAVKPAYVPVPADLGSSLTVTVTGSMKGSRPVSRTSAASAEVAKGTLTGKAPKITGTRKSGNTLKADAGTWTPGGVTLSYQWYRGSTLLKGATKTSYRLTAKDKGTTIRVVVRGSKPGYTAAEYSAGVPIAK